LDSQILSLSIPFALIQPRSKKSVRQNFFRELLPEGRMLESLAWMANIPTNDVVGLLRAYGRDIAGALQIWDPDWPGEPRTPAIEEVTESDVAILLREVTRN